jgi:hypothetical protein
VPMAHERLEGGHADGAVRVGDTVRRAAGPWTPAARTERSAGGPGLTDDFVYLYLGEGLGSAIVSDGEVRIRQSSSSAARGALTRWSSKQSALRVSVWAARSRSVPPW